MIVFTFGINDQGVARVKPDPSGRPNFDPDGTCAAYGNVDLGGQPFMGLLLYGPHDEQPVPKFPVKPTLVFNQISEPDSHRASLERCRRLCEGLEGAAVINHPDVVLRNSRDQVAEALASVDKVRTARVVRCRPKSPQDVIDEASASGVGFPCVFRTVGEHNAESLVRLDSEADIDALHAFALDGREHFLMEFVDTADEHGVYVKHRVVMVDGKPFAKHTLFTDQWIVNSQATDFMKAHPERGDILGLINHLNDELIPRHEATFTAIAEAIGLDYFGIDCHLADDGTVTVFEANANMGALKDSLRKAVPEAAHYDEALLAAVRAMMDDRSGYRPRVVN